MIEVGLQIVNDHLDNFIAIYGSQHAHLKAFSFQRCWKAVDLLKLAYGILRKGGINPIKALWLVCRSYSSVGHSAPTRV